MSDSTSEMLQPIQVFQDKIGMKWATWLSPKFDTPASEWTVVADGWLIEESTKEFVKKLEVAINSGKIVILSGNGV